MRTVLVICYSFTGTSRRLAQLMGARHGWPVGDVVEVRARSGFTGLWRCVLDAVLRRAPDVRYTGPAPESFDVVVLVGPVWLASLSGPMRSFVMAQGAKIQAWAAATTSGGGRADRVHAELQRLVGRPPVLVQVFSARAVEDGSCAAQVNWFGEVVSGKEGVVQRSAEWSARSA